MELRRGLLPLAVFLPLVCVGASALCGEAKGPAAPPTTMGEAEAAGATIRKLAQLYVAPIGLEATVPLAKAAELLADDAVAIWSDGRAVKGKKQLVKRSAAAIAEIKRLFATFEVAYNVRQVRLLTDAAIVVGDVRLAGTLKEGQQPWQRAIWMTLIFQKRPEGWRLIQEHSTRTTSPPPAPEKPMRGEM